MKILGWGVFLLALASPGWATFSIVAVDTVTGEVGSAGASCLDDRAVAGGVLIISDVIPGKGAIHTQASHNATNKQNAHNRMVAGDSPQQIITWLSQNDVQNNPGIRQYGVVDLFQGSARSAAYTGVNCQAYRGHLTGLNYAIQGNILLNRGILDSMQARFLNTPGTLADKLMSALQGANVPGADTRCLSEGVSSQSSFLRVARSGDSPTALYLDLRITRRPTGVEPIDTLQTLYDRWKTALPVEGKLQAPNARSHASGRQPAWKRIFGPLILWEGRARDALGRNSHGQ